MSFSARYSLSAIGLLSLFVELAIQGFIWLGAKSWLQWRDMFIQFWRGLHSDGIKYVGRVRHAISEEL
eukprot:scaffold391199_cov29-Prasinocladus_malaysianus.AAC.1